MADHPSQARGLPPAFAAFEIGSVAAFGDVDQRRLLADEGIVRNRAKVEATIENARAALRLREMGESLSGLIWSFRPQRQATPRSGSDLPATTPESTALAKELKRRGFRFIGPTTAYALMQACGLVNDHLAGCAVRDEVEKERRRLTGQAGH